MRRKIRNFGIGLTWVLPTVLAMGMEIALGTPAQAQERYVATDLSNIASIDFVNGMTSNGQVYGDANAIGFIYNSTGFHYTGTLVAGGGTSVYGANNSGMAVGLGDVAPGQPEQAFLYDSSGIHALGTLPGGDFSFAQAINSSGVIAGYSTKNTPATGPSYDAVYWDSTGIHDLGNYGTYAGAFAINDSGQMLIDSGNGQYFYDHGASYGITPPAGGSVTATRLNNVGQVTGYYTDGNGDTHAFLYTTSSFTDLGTLPGGTYSYGYAINDNGIVAGDADNSNGVNDSFLYDSTGMHDLGSFGGGSSTYGINNAGDVVGVSYDANGNALAYLYDGTNMIDLNTITSNLSGFTLDFASVIGENNDISASGHDSNGNEHYFLLTPASSVPEPSVVALLVAGGVCGAGLLRRRRAKANLRPGRGHE